MICLQQQTAVDIIETEGPKISEKENPWRCELTHQSVLREFAKFENRQKSLAKDRVTTFGR